MISNWLLAAQYYKENMNKRKMRAALAMLGVIVMALILILSIIPGRADDGDFICGFVAHTHTDECYRLLECIEEDAHEHGIECYGDPQLNCDLVEGIVEGHIHNEDCYSAGMPDCGEEERPRHTHGASCYDSAPLTCDEEHSHDGDCYGDPELICWEDETEGHTHNADCAGPPELICEEEEDAQAHYHGSDCYDEPELTCAETGHVHGDDCYILSEDALCGFEAHEHDEVCLPEDEEELDVPRSRSGQLNIILCDHLHDESCGLPQERVCVHVYCKYGEPCLNFDGTQLIRAMAGDVTNRLTFTYLMTGPGPDYVTPIPVEGDDFIFRNVTYTLIVNWALANDSEPIAAGDTMQLTMVFDSDIWFNMGNNTFNIMGTRPDEPPEVAGTATISTVSGDYKRVYIDVEFNEFLANLNNIQGTFTFSFTLGNQNNSGDQGVKVEGGTTGSVKTIGTGIVNPEVGPNEPLQWLEGRVFKYGSSYSEIVPNTIQWSAALNIRSQPKDTFLGSNPPATIRVIDELGPGQVMAPFYGLDHSVVPSFAIEPSTNDPENYLYGGDADTDAYFMVYAVDLRDIWQYYKDAITDINKWYHVNYTPSQMFTSGMILSVPDLENYYSTIPNRSWLTPSPPVSIPITGHMDAFISSNVLLRGHDVLDLVLRLNYAATDANPYWDPLVFMDGSTVTQQTIVDFNDKYVTNLTKEGYISNIERTATGFSFDLKTEAVDGKVLFLTYYSTVVNTSQMDGPGNNKIATNTLRYTGTSQSDNNFTREMSWTGGAGTVVGDTGTLTIFKHGPSGANLSGAVFEVERYNSAGEKQSIDSRAGQVVDDTLTMTITSGVIGSDTRYWATSGQLGSWGDTDYFKITEITPPSGMTKYPDPIYVRINPSSYVITAFGSVDSSGVWQGSVTPTSTQYGVADNDGNASASGRNIFVYNTDDTPPPPQTASVTIVGKKYVNINGAPPSGSEIFHFTLTQVANAQGDPMSGSAITRNASVTYTGSNPQMNFNFPIITDLTSGTYYFKITETAGSTSGWAYDDGSYIVKVVVQGSRATVYYPDGTVVGGMTDQEINAQRITINPTVTVSPSNNNTQHVGIAGTNPIQYRDIDGYTDNMHYRYITNSTNSGQVVIGAAYCLDDAVGLLGSSYGQYHDYAGFKERYEDFHDEILWLLRNGFMSTTSRNAGNSATGWGTSNNLDEFKDLTSSPDQLTADEAYTATQLAIWHFTNPKYSPYFATSNTRVNNALGVLMAKATEARNNSNVMNRMGISVEFKEIAGTALNGTWYGPLTVDVKLLPAGFTGLDNIPVTLTALNGTTLSTTASGSGSSTLTLNHSGTNYGNFYINIGTNPPTGSVFASVRAEASVTDTATVKDVLIVRGSSWTNAQAAGGVGAMTRPYDISASATLFYNATSGDGLVFINDFGDDTPQPIDASFNIRKTVSAETDFTAPSSWSFDFAIYPANPTDGNKANTTALQTITLTNGAPSAPFAVGPFTDVGTYDYLVEETSVNGSGWAVSTAQYWVRVTVALSGSDFTVSSIQYKTRTSSGAAWTPGANAWGAGQYYTYNSAPQSTWPVFDNKYSATLTNTVLQANKTITGSTSRPEWSFDFDLYASTSTGTPGTLLNTKRINGASSSTGGNVTFDPQTYTAPDTYYYIIREKIPVSGTEGWTYSGTLYHVRVPVTDNGSGELVVGTRQIRSSTDNGSNWTDWTNYSAESAAFVNIYSSPITVQLKAIKTATGAAMEVDQFEFELYSLEIDSVTQPLILDENTLTLIGTKKNTAGASSQIVFDVLTFPAPGTYMYILREKPDSIGHWKTDDTYYLVEIEVELVGTELTSTVTYTAVDNEGAELPGSTAQPYDAETPATWPVFVNEYSGPKLPEVGGTGLRTFILMGLALTLVAGAALILAHIRTYNPAYAKKSAHRPPAKKSE